MNERNWNPIEKYDANIKTLVEMRKVAWANPEGNREHIVRYGIPLLDKALYGIDAENGELNLIIGPEKRRKTTFVINVLINIFLSELPVVKPSIVIDTLESGMPPERYTDTLISNVSARLLLGKGHKPKEFCPVCNEAVCRELVLSPEFLRYNTRSQQQLKAIEEASDIVSSWPLQIYGPAFVQGDTRNLGKAKKRWFDLVEKNDAKIFIVDHLQQYSIQTANDDYEKQLRVVSAMGDMVAQKKLVVFLVSQISLTSQRLANEGSGKWGATGGQKGAQEANTIFATDYAPGSGEMRIEIQDSRRSPPFSMFHAMDDESGAFYGVGRKEGKFDQK